MSTTELPPTTTVADATPQEQLNLVDHLQRRLREQFSGSAPEFEVIKDRYPGKVLQLGVIPPLPKPVIPSANLPFVGDAQEWRYYRNTPETADGIPEEERIFLPSEPIAKLWGAEEQEAQ